MALERPGGAGQREVSAQLKKLAFQEQKYGGTTEEDRFESHLNVLEARVDESKILNDELDDARAGGGTGTGGRGGGDGHDDDDGAAGGAGSDSGGRSSDNDDYNVQAYLDDDEDGADGFVFGADDDEDGL